MLPEKDRVRLQHMLDSVREAVDSAEGREVGDLLTDRPLWHTCVHCLEIIGEAASQVTQPTRAQRPDLPREQMTGMRNRLIHAYFDVEPTVIWRTVTEDLPPLIAALEAVLPENQL